ncbi:FmdB family zinc ribbon protein [Heliorestis convoluta]|uniref:FmdB family zinc ribbon protein n=1 Tax=Heliorestis convoluta TaxID=356322 RepID=UPI001FAB205D|nr:FmdB family zinc ribbon protein [Heliorestis convoluta]
MYEYRCIHCNHLFSLLRPYSSRDEQVICPHCQSDQVRRLVSSFASNTNSSSSGSSCGSGGFFR